MMYKQVIEASFCCIPCTCLYYRHVQHSTVLSTGAITAPPFHHSGVSFYIGRYGEQDYGCILSFPVVSGQIKPCIVIHFTVNITA